MPQGLTSPSMAVRVRLTRVGSKKNPIWRVVVADQRSPRDGRFIEMLGHYNPQTEPSIIRIDRDRLQHWLDRGAMPTDTVRKLMRAEDSDGVPPTAAQADERRRSDAAPSSEADDPRVEAKPTAEEEAPAGGSEASPSEAEVPDPDAVAVDSELEAPGAQADASTEAGAATETSTGPEGDSDPQSA